MKQSFPAALLFFALPLVSLAQNSAFWDVNSPRRPDSIPAIKVVRPAEVLAADVTIVATSRNAIDQAAMFTQALGYFRTELARTPNVSIKRERTEQGGGSPSYLSSGKFDTNRSFAEFTVHVALQDGVDSTAAAQALRSMIARVKLTGDVAIKIEALRVEVRDPDALREILLRAIAEDSGRIQGLFKSAPVKVTGLEAAVLQRPFTDREVIAFIPYTLSIGGH